MLTQSEENYLKAIYSLTEVDSEIVSTNMLSDKMKTKPSSVTDMLRKLADKSLVSYLKYQGCELTEKGKKYALQIIRKHRLWEVFLVEKLNFGWEEVHEIAEQLEHIKSSKLTDKLDAFLHYPKVDPHGDPIPDKNGHFSNDQKAKQLSLSNVNDEVVITGVEDGSVEFFQFLKHCEIGLGTKVKIIAKYNFDQSVLISLNEKEIVLSELVSQKIYVQ
jgi:DtxR family Mn-dependent transcriptional regulator